MANQPATSRSWSQRWLAERTTRAALVGLAVLLVTGGTLGFAAAANGPANGLPAEFSVAAPRDGDRYAYALTLDGDWLIDSNDTVRLGAEFPAFDFAWKGTEELRLADGRLHHVARVDRAGVLYSPWISSFAIRGDPHQAWTAGNATAWFDVQGVRAYERPGGAGRASGGGALDLGIAGVPPLFESGSSISTQQDLRTFGSEESCLVANALQGHNVSTSKTVVLSAPCGLGGVLALNDEKFRAAAVETIGGIETVRYDSQQAPAVSFWFNPAVPYPVQVTFQAPPAHPAGSASGTLRLTGYSPAGEALPARDEAGHDPAPALVSAAARPWGPDDAGTTFAFPLSDAFQRARDDKDWKDLASYLQAHPTAYTASAWSQIVTRTAYTGPLPSDDGEDRAWYVLVSDGASCFRFEATRSVRPGMLPPPLGSPQTTYSYTSLPSTGSGFGSSDGNTDCGPRHLPPVGPTQWPTVASATALWQAYASPAELAEGANGWSFDMRMVDGEVHLDVDAGQTANIGHEASSLSSMDFASGPKGAALTVTDAEVVSYSRVAQAAATYQDVAQLTPPASSARPTGPSASHAALASIAGAFVLTPAAATGAGLLALVSGLVYWLWPLARGAPLVGLFSRVENDRLLDHPVRAQLLQRIEAEPGIHYQALVRATGHGKGMIEHHLRRLETAGVAKAVRGPRFTCYFPTSTPVTVRNAAPALKSDGAQQVLAAIRARPRSSGLEVSQATGLATSTVSEQVAKLTAAGLVAPLRDGRSVRFTATELAQTMVSA